MLKRLHLYKSSNGGTKNPQMAERKILKWRKIFFVISLYIIKIQYLCSVFSNGRNGE